MNRRLIPVMAAAFLLILSAALRLPGLAANDDDSPPDFTKQSFCQLGIEPVPAQKDSRTGFVVAGRNATEVVAKLSELNGRTIAELESEMRPGAASAKGFLGADEGLLAVLTEDNRYVVDELQLTHPDLALYLRAFAEIGSPTNGKAFVYRGRRFKVTLRHFRGYQESPFHDGTKTNSEATIENLENGKSIDYSLLVPAMIERYGFYEGKGTPYRVDPARVVEVLDFLKPDRASRKPAGR